MRWRYRLLVRDFSEWVRSRLEHWGSIGSSLGGFGVLVRLTHLVGRLLWVALLWLVSRLARLLSGT